MTDAATVATQAEFGAFFYNVLDRATGESYMLYTLSGARRRPSTSFHNREQQTSLRRPSTMRALCAWTM